jgi:Mrp family chromosome partitioning ATPase
VGRAGVNAADREGGQATSELPGADTFLRGGRVAEQYRTLRAVIEAAGPKDTDAAGDASLIVLVVGVDHGVADVGIRLAAAFADGGRATLLVDADLRGGGRHRLLRPGGPAPLGVSEWLRSVTPPAELPAYPSGLANLAVAPAGGAGPTRSDPLASGHLAGFIAAIRRERERAVLVTAPLGQVADALFLAPYADGVLLVVAPGRTHGPTATRARDALLATGARLYGVVLGEAEAR